MPGLSNALEQSVLYWLFKQTTFPAVPTTLWVSVHTADPTDAGGSEVSTSGTAYARQQLDPDTSSASNTRWSAIGAATTPATAQQITNNADITYLAATANYNGTSACTHFGLYSAVTAGTFYGSGTINGGTGVIVLNGNQLRFPAGNLAFQID